MQDSQSAIVPGQEEDQPVSVQSAGWTSRLGAELRLREGEEGVDAFKRMVASISAVLDNDRGGEAVNAVEALVGAMRDEIAELRHAAFRAACSSVSGWLGAQKVKAGLVMAPLIIRGPRKSDFPRQIDPITCGTIQKEANARLKAAGFDRSRLVPVSAIVTPEEVQEAPATMYYRLLRAALETGGAKMGHVSEVQPGSLPADALPGSPVEFDASLLALQWSQLQEVHDTGAFVEIIGTPTRNPQMNKAAQQWAVPRLMLFVWMGAEDAEFDCAMALDASPGWRQWLSQILEGYRLDPEQVEMLQAVRHPLSAYIVEGQGVTFEEAKSQSVSILGLDVPISAMQTLTRRCSLMRACHALQLRGLDVDMDAAPVGSITYSPSRDVLSIKLDDRADDPDLMIGTIHSVWMYPFIADLREAMLTLGCSDVKTRILDRSIQTKGGEASFRAVH